MWCSTEPQGTKCSGTFYFAIDQNSVQKSVKDSIKIPNSKAVSIYLGVTSIGVGQGVRGGTSEKGE